MQNRLNLVPFRTVPDYSSVPDVVRKYGSAVIATAAMCTVGSSVPSQRAVSRCGPPVGVTKAADPAGSGMLSGSATTG